MKLPKYVYANSDDGNCRGIKHGGSVLWSKADIQHLVICFREILDFFNFPLLNEGK